MVMKFLCAAGAVGIELIMPRVVKIFAVSAPFQLHRRRTTKLITAANLTLASGNRRPRFPSLDLFSRVLRLQLCAAESCLA